MYGNLPPVELLKSGAGLVDNSTNPTYTAGMFLAAFPEFTGKVTDALISKWIALANDCFSFKWYGSCWELAMGLFTAHNLILKLKAGNADTPEGILLARAGETGAQVGSGHRNLKAGNYQSSPGCLRPIVAGVIVWMPGLFARNCDLTFYKSDL